MKQYVRCKVCGYIMEADKLGEFCPACGVSAKAFEPYQEKVSEKRMRWLDLHMHPIVVHLAQGMAPLIVVLAAALAVLGEGALKSALLDTTKVLAALLPFAVILAFGAGLIDGKLRFRKLRTQILIRKMITGGVFFLASAAAGAIALFSPLAGGTLALFALLELLSLAAAVLLGHWGFHLITAKMPG